jgi:hypothetical protein
MKKHNGYTVIYKCGHDRTVYVNEGTWYSLACAAQNQECSACFRHTINATTVVIGENGGRLDRPGRK